jgi:isopenicillin N synthase-like dioxygenase
MTISQDPQIANIPVIDIGVLRESNPSPSAIEEVVNQVRSACIHTGFFQIVNHGVSPSLQKSVFEASKNVFALPHQEKLALKRDPFGNRGYEILEGQSLDGAVEGLHKNIQSEYGGNDLKEGYYVGKERLPDDPMLQRRFNGLNKWPPGIPEFRPVMSEYYEIMYGLAVQMMELIAL